MKKRLFAGAAAVSLVAVGFLASASPASATTCEYYRQKGSQLPEHCHPKPTRPPKTTTTTAPATTTTTAKATTTTTVVVKPETKKPVAVKATPKFTG